MAINKKTHMIISVVIPVDIEKELTKKAKVNNRRNANLYSKWFERRP